MRGSCQLPGAGVVAAAALARGGQHLVEVREAGPQGHRHDHGEIPKVGHRWKVLLVFGLGRNLILCAGSSMGSEHNACFRILTDVILLILNGKGVCFFREDSRDSYLLFTKAPEACRTHPILAFAAEANSGNAKLLLLKCRIIWG